MENKKADRRVTRTRRMLRDAMMGLTLEKGFESITIEEITSRADIGRATFYLHYRDKEDLLLESIDSAINDLIAQISHLPISTWVLADDVSDEAITEHSPIYLVFQHAAENADLYRIILRGEGVPQAQKRIRNLIARSVSEFLSMKIQKEGLEIHPTVPLEVFANYFAGSLLGILSWWLEAERPYPTSEMAEMFRKMLYPGAKEVIGVSFP